MKRFFLSALFLSCFFLAGNVFAQSNDNTSQGVIIIKTADDDGTVTVKKKRLDKGQSADEYVKELDLKDAKNVEVIISSTGDENSVSGENLFLFKHNGNTIKINGDGDWQEALIDMDFDFSDLHEIQEHHGNVQKIKKENDVLLGVYPDNGEVGVVVDGIVAGSGADKAGLKKNDIMTAINGTSIRTTGDLHDVLGAYKVDDVVVIDVLREGQTVVVSSTLTGRMDHSYRKSERDPCKVFFGVYVGNYGSGREGVGVSGIIPGNGWPAEQAGLQKGDRILAIDGIPIGTHNELVTERDKHEPGQAFSFTYMRDGQVYETDARFKECPKDQEVEERAPVEEIIPAPEELEFTDNALELDEFNAYPNPTFGNLNVRFSGEAVPTLVRIVDSAGKLVYEENIKNFSGYYNKELDISGGALGTMILSISQNGKTLAKPVVLVTRA